MRSIKNKIKSGSYIAMALLLTFLSACTKDESDKELGAAPSADQIKIIATPTAANANIVDFKSESPGFKAIWDFGNGATAEGTTAQASYPLAGTYTVKLKIVTSGGFAEKSMNVTIATTNPAMLTDPAFTLISGGLTNTNGKTWVIDKTEVGHLGVGPITSGGPDWYQAGPNEKAAEGFYDDEMIFNMNGLKYTYANNGTTFANGSNSAGIGGPGGSADVTLSYTPPTNLTWLVTTIGGKKYITISNNGFISYYVGVSQYEILALTADEMWLRSTEKANSGNAWYLKLIRKGYVRPVVPPVAKPIQAANLFDDFDATGNITWLAENMNYKRAYDNPFPLTPNTSPKVAYYEKKTGSDFQYGNLQMTSAYRFDLAAKNKIKIKAYFPGANDYPNVASTISIKLQNSLLGGNSWTTQREVVKTITSAQYNKWIDLEFDFSGWASDTVYDKIVVQLGGEGHPNPGIFYIDDFQFK